MVWLASILEIYPLTVSKPEIRDWGGPSEVVGESLLPSSLLHCMVCWPSQVSWTCRSSAQSLFSSVYDVLPGCLSVSKFPLLIRTFVVVVQLLSSVQLFWDSWTVAYQAPLYMGFSRQEYWSGLPCPPPDKHTYICLYNIRFGTQEERMFHCFPLCPFLFAMKWWTDAMIFVFWMLSFKPAFSLSSSHSSRSSLVLLHFLPWEGHHLYI